ncbi:MULTISPECIES: hypothetical protein [unclassified Mycoplasma]|uniref:hypothetical protein n=1 Tax=unclassified Mycoplasma TaxID=2683645 RepID=UPI00216AF678|nr:MULTISPECIES: hypothetical protein [unclassified Mycoplasma]MCS4537089.1 hypothetical protein [Mycoplasma sp. CSL7475-4]MCT4469777.1 hypothetical protein [Mycoplasma sp. HS2188]
MAYTERDPLISKEKIEKRREELLKLYEENKLLLQNPALVEQNNMQEHACDNAECLLNQGKIDAKELKKRTIQKYIAIFSSIAIIVILLVVAIFIGRIEN